MIHYEEPLFRPPAEAESLIFQVVRGCPHNTCRFCGMYKGVRCHVRPESEVLAEIAAAGKYAPDTRRIFLADGDAMNLPFEQLQRCAVALNEAFPTLGRINCYANAGSIMNKSDEELLALRQLKMQILYVGLESGSDDVLRLFRKGETVEGNIEAVRRAQSAGFKCSVMILLGLGGRELQSEHIAGTVDALNRMQPKLLSALRWMELPGLPPPEGLTMVSEYEAVGELRQIVAGLNLSHTVFRANHTSNPFPLSGRFPQDKGALLHTLEAQLSSGGLDRVGPGTVPLFL